MKRGERSKMNMNTKCILKYRFLVWCVGGIIVGEVYTIITLVVKKG